MKKLSILFVLVLLAFCVQAQDRSQIIGEWKIDKEAIFKLQPNLEENYNDNEGYRKYLDTYFQITILFKEDKNFLQKDGENTYEGTWKLEGKLLKMYDDDNDKDLIYEIISLDNTTMIVLDSDSGIKYGLKRLK